MSVFTEGAPLEVLEEVGDNIGDIAKKAKDEIINIQLAGENEFTTTGISDFKYWLKNKALTDETSVAGLKEKLKKAGFFKNNEKSTIVTPEDNVVRVTDDKLSVTSAIDNIIQMLDEFITNPTGYRDRNISNLKMLIQFLETFSE